MNSILRALAARWPLILITTLACLLGGLWVVTTSQPRYQGSARVILDYIKPDPVTGEVVSWKMLDAYLGSQLRLLRDQQVAAPAAELLGWFDNPDVLAAYAARPASDTRDINAWVSSILIPRIGARMVEGSNIMEISYSGESETESMAAAEALRTAYIQSSIKGRQDASRLSAEKIQARIGEVRKELAALQTDKMNLQNETGVVLVARGIDEASNQLRLMTKRPDGPLVLRDSGGSPPSSVQLAQLEAVIARASQNLGPNNPDLIQLLRKREALRTQVATESLNAGSKAAAIMAASQASAARYESLKREALAAREPALRLKLVQDQIEGRQAEFLDLTEAMVALRSMQTSTVSTISPMGAAYAQPKPVFPNPGLIFGGTGVLGLILGSILACLSELMGRRVRTQAHLETAAGAAMLIEIPDLKPQRGRRLLRRRARKVGVVRQGPELATA
jgi:succinoglycan biosynthesis transport protein ExoP